MTLPAESVIRSLEQALEQDKRVKAAWLKGSFARVGDADRHSDIDLHVGLLPTMPNLFGKGSRPGSPLPAPFCSITNSSAVT